MRELMIEYILEHSLRLAEILHHMDDSLLLQVYNETRDFVNSMETI